MSSRIITGIHYASVDASHKDTEGDHWIGYTIQLASSASPASQGSQAPRASPTASASQASSNTPIGVYIDLYQQCCERYDVLFLAPDGKTEADFLGADLRRVGWGRDFKKQTTLHDLPFDPRDTPHAVVNIDTDRGRIQLVAFNDHNGYYPHSVKVHWGDYADIQEL